MPRKSDNIAIRNENLDRRVKLTHRKKEWMKHLNETDKYSQRELARMFNVSRRLVTFVLYPEKHEENLKRREERGGSRIYYSKDKWRETMKEHRDYKKKLYKEGKIK